MRKVLSLVLVAVFLVSLFGGLSVVPSAKAVAQEVTYNMGAEPVALDPAIGTSTADGDTTMQVFDGLTRIGSSEAPHSEQNLPLSFSTPQAGQMTTASAFRSNPSVRSWARSFSPAWSMVICACRALISR